MTSSIASENQDLAMHARVKLQRVLTLRRIFFSVCIVFAPLILLLGFVFDPQLGVPTGAMAYIAALRVENPLMVQLFLVVFFVTPCFFPFSYIGLGWLALRRSPWLATFGIICGLVGSLPWPLLTGQLALAYSIAQMGDSPSLLELANRFTSNWMVALLLLSWVIGHLLGYMLLGIALIRSRAIPRWAAILIVASVPFQMIAYPLNQGVFQIIGFAMVLIGSVPAAYAMWHFRIDPLALPVGEPTSSTS